MDATQKYQEAKALAETNYRHRVEDAQRLMEEARTIYESDLEKALVEWRKQINSRGE